MAPTIGRIVHYTQPQNEPPRNGSRVHPAIVTRVWTEGEKPIVNLTVFFDGVAIGFRSSVEHFSVSGTCGWDWPPRA